MKIKEKGNNLTSKIISNAWGTLEQVRFDFTFKKGKIARLTHEVYGKGDGVAVLLHNTRTKKVVLSK
jgi:hypothetical protein